MASRVLLRLARHCLPHQLHIEVVSGLLLSLEILVQLVCVHVGKDLIQIVPGQDFLVSELTVRLEQHLNVLVVQVFYVLLLNEVVSESCLSNATLVSVCQL